MLTRAKPATGTYEVVQMGTEVNCSKDDDLKEKGPLHGLCCHVGTGHLCCQAALHLGRTRNPDVFNVTFSDCLSDGNS